LIPDVRWDGGRTKVDYVRPVTRAEYSEVG